MTHLDPKFSDCATCGFPTLHHHTDPGWKCTQCGAESQEPARGASAETNIRAAIKEADKLMRGPGVIEWVEKLANIVHDMPDRILNHYNKRMYKLISDFGKEIGEDLDHVDKARFAASMIIGTGNDDDDPEPEPAPAPQDDKRERV